MLKKFVCCLTAALLLAGIFVLAGCKEEETGDILYEIVVDGSDCTINVGTSYQMPAAHLVDKSGNKAEGELSYQVRNPNDTLILTSYGSFRCNVLGDYKISYIAKNAETKIVTVSVKDLEAPKVTVSVPPELVADTDIRMPVINFEDYSDIDYSATTIKLYKNVNGTETEYPYDEFKNYFHPDESAYYTLKVHAADIAGNAADYEWKFNVIDPDWVPVSLEEDVIADFSEEEYRNIILTGTTKDWSSHNTLTWLNEFEGAEGVYKIDMKYNNYTYGYSIFNCKFPTPVKRSDVNAIAVRMYIENVNCSMFPLFKYKYTYDSVLGQIPIAHCLNQLEEGKWFNLIFDSSMLGQMMNSDGYIEGFQIGGEHMRNDSSDSLVIYIDEIFAATRLSAPTGFTFTDSAISWDPVENASGYAVNINGTEQIVSGTQAPLSTSESCIVKIKALGQGKYIDSAYGQYIVNREPLEENHLSDFNSDFYAQLIGKDSYGGGYWYPSAMETSYVTECEGTNDGALKVTLTYSSKDAEKDGLACIYINFAKQISASEAQGDLQIRFKISGTGRIAEVGTSKMAISYQVTDPDAQGWAYIRIPKSALTANYGIIHGVTLLLRGDKSGVAEWYFDYAGIVTPAEVPSYIRLEDGVLIWDESEYADGYVVDVDGEEFTVSENRYEFEQVKPYYRVRIKALGGEGYADSPWSNYSVLSVKTLEEGVYGDFSDESYLLELTGDFVEFWKASSFSAEYQPSVAGTEDGAIVVKMTANSNAYAAVGINFRKPITENERKNGIYLRYKLEGAELYGVGSIRTGKYYFENGNITITEDADGWKILFISFSMPNTSGTIEGFEILLWKTAGVGAEITFTVDEVSSVLPGSGELGENVYADFSSATYALNVGKVGNGFWDADSLQAEYVPQTDGTSDGALKITLGVTQNNTASFLLNLGKNIVKSTAGDIQIRIRCAQVGGDDNRLYGILFSGNNGTDDPANTTGFTIEDDTDGWKIITIQNSRLVQEQTDKIGVMFGYASGLETIIVELDYVCGVNISANR